jgi:hypothetical protein
MKLTESKEFKDLINSICSVLDFMDKCPIFKITAKIDPMGDEVNDE